MARNLKNTAGNDSMFLENLAEQIESSSTNPDRFLLSSRIKEIGYKIKHLESVLVAQWLGAMTELEKYKKATGEAMFCKKTPACYRLEGHEGKCLTK